MWNFEYSSSDDGVYRPMTDGERKELKEGVKHDKGKTEWAYLLKELPEECEEIIQVMMFGAEKYDKNNWHKVLLADEDNERYLNASARHIVAYHKAIRDGKEPLDKESGLPSLAHAGACILFQMSKERLDK